MQRWIPLGLIAHFPFWACGDLSVTTMLIKEYRIPLPLTVEEYRIAQLYMIAVSFAHLMRESDLCWTRFCDVGRKKAEKRATAKGAGWKSSWTNRTKMVQEATASTPRKSTTSAVICQVWYMKPNSIKGDCVDYKKIDARRVVQESASKVGADGRGGGLERLPVHQNKIHHSLCWKVLHRNRNLLLWRQRPPG